MTRWRSSVTARSVRTEVTLGVGLRTEDLDGLHRAAEGYAAHLGLDADLVVSGPTS